MLQGGVAAPPGRAPLGECVAAHLYNVAVWPFLSCPPAVGRGVRRGPWSVYTACGRPCVDTCFLTRRVSARRPSSDPIAREVDEDVAADVVVATSPVHTAPSDSIVEDEAEEAEDCVSSVEFTPKVPDPLSPTGAVCTRPCSLLKFPC